MKLSVLMPAFNETTTIAVAVKRLLAVDFPCEVELVVVDDGSTDGCREVIAGLDDPRIVTRLHDANRGKGQPCALRPRWPPATMR